MFTEIKTQAKNLLASVKTLYLCCCNAIRHSKIPFKLKKISRRILYSENIFWLRSRVICQRKHNVGESLEYWIVGCESEFVYCDIFIKNRSHSKLDLYKEVKRHYLLGTRTQKITPIVKVTYTVACLARQKQRITFSNHVQVYFGINAYDALRIFTRDISTRRSVHRWKSMGALFWSLLWSQ